jgi:uncharacterized membrane protein YhaH (DUF805 family)
LNTQTAGVVRDCEGDGLLDRKQIDWTELLFSSTGRMGRGAFLAVAALLLLIGLGYRALVGDALWTGWIVYAALLFSAACIVCKRLHDRGRAGWWAFLVIWAVMAAWARPQGPALILPALILLGAVVDLAILPGRRGSNRFGLGPA